MKKIALLAVAAAATFVTPAMLSPASAETDINVRIGTPAPAYRAYSQQRVVVRSPSHCRTVTVRTKRANGSVHIKKIRRCS